MALLARHRVLNGLRITLALLVVAAVAFAVARNWEEVVADLRRADLSLLLLAAVLVCIPPVFTLLGWRTLLADLGSPLHLAPAGGIFFVGQLGKYVPGTVWSIVAQAEMGARLHIPRSRSAVVGLITVGLAAVCGLIVGLPALPLLFDHDDTRGVAWSMLGVVPLVALLFWPGLLNRLIAFGLRVLRREPLEHSLSGRAVLVTSASFIVAWLASGTHVWALTRALADAAVSTERMALITLAGFALASAVAMFSLVMPAGVGVREGVLVLLLAPVTSTATATAVVVLSRFLTIMADLVFALAGWAWARSHHLITTRAERVKDGVLIDGVEEESGV